MPMINIDLSNLPHVTNKIYYPLYTNKNRYLILYGGAGSGKSVFAAQKIIFRLLTEKGHKFLVVRKVAKTLRESTFSLLRGVISDWGMSELFDVNKTDMTITCKLNQNKIIHAGLDDVEKMKSIHGVTSIWIEEASELEQQDFQQLDLRLRGHTKHYKQIMLSFNPISVLHWIKELFFDREKKDTKIVHSTYLNNEFIDDTYKNVLNQMKEEDEYYYQVYALGQWGTTGKTIFPARIVNERIAYLRNQKSIKQGFFIFDYVHDKIIDSSIKWVDDEQGMIRIYEDRQDRYPYVLGGDTAGEGSDYFTGHVINNITGNQCATFHNQMDEDLYVRQMYCLGKYYNTALIGIESNFSTFPIKELERLGYSKQYYREVVDSITNKEVKKYGFVTTSTSRTMIISNLVKKVREHSELIQDRKTLEEMLTFVRNERGKPEAQEGKHDDLIMGLAIAEYIRAKQIDTLDDNQSYLSNAISHVKRDDKHLPHALQEEDNPISWNDL